MNQEKKLRVKVMYILMGEWCYSYENEDPIKGSGVFNSKEAAIENAINKGWKIVNVSTSEQNKAIESLNKSRALRCIETSKRRHSIQPFLDYVVDHGDLQDSKKLFDLLEEYLIEYHLRVKESDKINSTKIS